MISIAIPRRYARAFMGYVRDHQLDIHTVSENFRLVAEHFAPGGKLHGFLGNALISNRDKTAVIDSFVVKTKIPQPLDVFIRLLQRRGRLILLPEIYREFRRLADELQGILRGDVFTAADLPEKVIASLRDKFSSVTSKKVILTVRKNPAIIGGLVVKVGSLSMDGSIRAHLDGIREKLSERVKA
jgi:F-type H+-transporting ATPase subunit delta